MRVCSAAGGRASDLAPGAYERAGFPTAYVTGFGTPASCGDDRMLLVTSQTVDSARSITQAVEISFPLAHDP